MITFAEARDHILDQVRPLDVVTAKLTEMHGHYLAQALVTPFDLPLFDNSAVDGFGVLAKDIVEASPQTAVRLNLAGTIAAGEPSEQKLASGSTLKILTGAPVPSSVEAVVMREFCEELDGEVFFHQMATAGENIRRRGGEFLRGQEVLAKGSLVTPPVIGLLAALGHESFAVHRQPQISIVATGNELIEPGEQLSPGKIYQSNSYALTAALKSFGIEKSKTHRCEDDLKETKRRLASAAKSSDVIISTGGVSVGDFDYVKTAAEELGFETVLWRIALKPGKPVCFGKLEHKQKTTFLFGLPGNPVSSLVTLTQLVKPALLKMLGAQSYKQPLFKAALSKTIKKKAGRLEFLRGTVSQGKDGLLVEPTLGQDSHMLSGLAKANCLIYFPLEEEVLEAGHQVEIEFLHWCP
jgi:molybdopterin molybdotransferase